MKPSSWHPLKDNPTSREVRWGGHALLVASEELASTWKAPPFSSLKTNFFAKSLLLCKGNVPLAQAAGTRAFLAADLHLPHHRPNWRWQTRPHHQARWCMCPTRCAAGQHSCFPLCGFSLMCCLQKCGKKLLEGHYHSQGFLSAPGASLERRLEGSVINANFPFPHDQGF